MELSGIWEGVITPDDEARYAAAGFGRPIGVGSRPALLIIDVQYRTAGTRPAPFFEALKEFPTSCGEAAWSAVGNVRRLLGAFRQAGYPVLYPHVVPKLSTDAGRLGGKVPAIMDIPDAGYHFVEEVKPADGDILLPKKHPSAFFGTPLGSHLVDLGGCVHVSLPGEMDLLLHLRELQLHVLAAAQVCCLWTLGDPVAYTLIGAAGDASRDRRHRRP
jgi:hypothetical protein